MQNKQRNKNNLQETLGFQQDESTLLMGVVCRLVPQKGIDILLKAIEETVSKRIYWVVLGCGDKKYEDALLMLAKNHPENISVMIGFDERMTHKIEASADVFVMPSYFEPCGLNQLYSLRYGTIPLVRKTGGLADTVVDANEVNIKNNTATGFVFSCYKSEALIETIERAVTLFKQKNIWQKIQSQGMKQEFSWKESASKYEAIYEDTISVYCE